MYRLMHLNGGYEINLDSQFNFNRKVVVGRGRANCDISIVSNKDTYIDRLVSRKHFVLTLNSGFLHTYVTIKDFESKNGTMLNGRKLNKARTLNHGDVITCGQTSLRFVTA